MWLLLLFIIVPIQACMVPESGVNLVGLNAQLEIYINNTCNNCIECLNNVENMWNTHFVNITYIVFIPNCQSEISNCWGKLPFGLKSGIAYVELIYSDKFVLLPGIKYCFNQEYCYWEFIDVIRKFR